MSTTTGLPETPAMPETTRSDITAPSTPTFRRALRRSLFWIIAVILLIVIAFAALALTQSARKGEDFSATNASPSGSQAVAEVLKKQGVTVVNPAGLAPAIHSLERTPSTLFLYDPNAHLSATQLKKLVKSADNVVLLNPGFRELRALAPAIGQAGAVNKKTLTANCALPAATRAEQVSGAGQGYRIIDQAAGAVGCFGSGGKTYSVIQLSNSGRGVTVIGTMDALTNEHIVDNGNAALALNILGQNSQLVWYLPTIADSVAAGPATLGSLTPPWVTPALILLVITTIAAAVWRGRRFGPLIIENLPVVVRSSETMHGRARLYQKSGARLRALDALRIGTIDRVARVCGLPRVARVDDVMAAAATQTGRSPAAVRNLLLDAVPASDRELVQLSDELLALEDAVSRSIRPH